jgi:hypothetical protein
MLSNHPRSKVFVYRADLPSFNRQVKVFVVLKILSIDRCGSDPLMFVD